jgi:Tfp pilus assembly protein PilE
MKKLMLTALAAVTIASAARAQAPAASDAEKRTAIADTKTALRNLVTAQEKYWADHGSYTTDGKSLGVYPNDRAKPFVQVIMAGSRGWTAVATHPMLKGKTCVLYVGNAQEIGWGLPETRADSTKASQEGAPVCDAP